MHKAIRHSFAARRFAAAAVAAALGASLAPGSRADTIYMTKTQTGDQTAFTDGQFWSDGAAPSSDKDYMTRISGTLRTPQGWSTWADIFDFKGRSLTIGDPDNPSTGGYMLLRTGAGGCKVSDLRLAGNAQISSGVNRSTVLMGATTVLADDDHPAVVHVRPGYTLTWNSQLSGAPGTRIRFDCETSAGGTLESTVDHVWTFAGTMELGDNLYFHPYHWNRIPSLCFNGTGARLFCEFEYPKHLLADSAGRAISVGPKGGTWLVSNWNKRTRVDWPVSGTGTLTVDGAGSGVLAFEGAFSGSPTIAVTDTGAIALTNGVSFAQGNGAAIALGAGTLHLSADAMPAPAAFSAADGATIVLYPDAATGETIPLKAASSAALSGTVAVKLAAYPGAMPDGGLLPFLVVPSATDLSGVTFDWQGVGYGQPVGEIVVSDPADGFVTVSAKLSTIAGPVTPTTGGSAATYFETASHWSDGLAHHATNYLVTGHSNVRATSADWVHTWECKADAVTLVDSRFLTKQRNRLYFKDLRLYGNSRLGIASFDGGAATEDLNLYGGLTVATDARGYDGVYFSCNNANFRRGIVHSALAGSGNLFLTGESVNAGGVVWQFCGDNAAYRGSIESYTTNAAWKVSLDAQSATALGGAPAAFLQHGLYLGHNATLNVTNVAVAVADATRGVTVSNATVNVGAGLDFAISSQTLLGGAVTKTGAGTWTLGGHSAPASDATLSVEEGTLAFAADDAASGVALSFADGAALGVVAPGSAGILPAEPVSAGSLPAESSTGVVLTNGLTAAGATLPVRIIAPGVAKSDSFRIAVFTAPAATVDALLQKLAGTASHAASAAVTFSASDAFTLGGVSVKTVTASVSPAAFILVVR